MASKNPEVRRKVNRAWYARDKAHARKLARKYYRKNRKKKVAYSKNYYRSHKEEIIDRNRKKMYGISKEQYNKLLHEQDGKCAICHQKPRLNKSLRVDHSHSHKIVRGLLCDRCNLALGHFEDDPLRMARAVDYIIERQLLGDAQWMFHS